MRIANALVRLWTARLPDFTCRSQPAARFCLFSGVMQHPTTSRTNSNSRRATQRLGIGDVHARLIRSRNSICIVSWGRHGTGTWEYYSSLRASWGGSLRRHARDMAAPYVQDTKLGLRQPGGLKSESQSDSTPSGTTPLCSGTFITIVLREANSHAQRHQYPKADARP